MPVRCMTVRIYTPNLGKGINRLVLDWDGTYHGGRPRYVMSAAQKVESTKGREDLIKIEDATLFYKKLEVPT